MKLHEIRSHYQLNQKTFYQWLRDTKMIKKGEKGYVVGENALRGMDNLYTEHNNSRTGRIETTSQVIIADEEVNHLVSLYLKSGQPNLYSRAKITEPAVAPENKVIEELQDRVTILENQVNILNIQLKRLMMNS